MIYLSVIIPAYNEEKRIGKTLEHVHDYLSRQSYSYEIIVVNDGSTDKTAKTVRGFIPRLSNLSLIDNKQNRGKGSVVRQGMLASTGKYRLFMDADNSTSIENVERLLPYAEEGADVVISSRRLAGAELEEDQSVSRLLLGKIFRLIVHTLVPLKVVDSQNGFKLFSAKAARALFPKQTIFQWAFDVEILALAQLSRFRIKEVPVRWINDDRSHVTLGGMVRMLVEITQVRLNLWTGKYGLR